MAVHRNKSRTEGARYAPCVRCGKEGETRAAHYCGFRSYAYGKGWGIKCDDDLTAYFCHTCDDDFSESSYHKWPDGSKDIERSEEFMHWINMTTIYINRE